MDVSDGRLRAVVSFLGGASLATTHSVGLEHPDDLIADFSNALEHC
jgi:hypothetical protein